MQQDGCNRRRTNRVFQIGSRLVATLGGGGAGSADAVAAGVHGARASLTFFCRIAQRIRRSWTGVRRRPGCEPGDDGVGLERSSSADGWPPLGLAWRPRSASCPRRGPPGARRHRSELPRTAVIVTRDGARGRPPAGRATAGAGRRARLGDGEPALARRLRVRIKKGDRDGGGRGRRGPGPGTDASAGRRRPIRADGICSGMPISAVWAAAGPRSAPLTVLDHHAPSGLSAMRAGGARRDRAGG